MSVSTSAAVFACLCLCGSCVLRERGRAWGCFDEFNRLEERILSAVSQQILTIQTAIRASADEVELIGRSLKLDAGMGIFITMNPVSMRGELWHPDPALACAPASVYRCTGI